MKFANGAKRRLGGLDLDADEVGTVLSRLELALPHLTFYEWHVGPHTCQFPEGEVAPIRNSRFVEVRLNIDKDLRLHCKAGRRFGYLSHGDRKFILHLALEAAQIIKPRLGAALSLFDFGSYAVGEVIKSEGGFEGDIVSILRFVRTLSQETYENERLSYGLIISSETDEGLEPIARAFDNKRLKCLTDGFSTALILDGSGRITDYCALNTPEREAHKATQRPWWVAGLAEASSAIHGVGIAMAASGEMAIVYRNRLWFSHRSGRWQFWNHSAIIERLKSEWKGLGPRGQVYQVIQCLYHLALDMSFSRSGCLLIILHTELDLDNLLVSTTDAVGANGRGPFERSLDELFGFERVQSIDRRVLADMASMDGAVICDRNGDVLAFGAMTKPASGSNQGARTRAAVAASGYGLAIKVSTDGQISVYAKRSCVMVL